ncbi:MAG: Trm112 family protein [Thermoproteales archaeon]|nr:Trm112 family protein [Thermoproteales archaeon]RLE65204.1 MAG: Trm112 family protein [Thermoprotei archaeon]
MKYRLLDLLACPYCKKFPLQLYVFEEKIYRERKLEWKKPSCELYCGFKKEYIDNLKETPPCEECIKNEIVYGILYCEKCSRWYPIREEIPIMLPDEYRKKDEDKSFLEKFKATIPKEILEFGRPVNLSK